MLFNWSIPSLTRRIGSDEEDNDSDQEESNEDELETAVSRQGSVLQSNDYVIVNRLTDSSRIMDYEAWEEQCYSQPCYFSSFR